MKNSLGCGTTANVSQTNEKYTSLGSSGLHVARNERANVLNSNISEIKLKRELKLSVVARMQRQTQTTMQVQRSHRFHAGAALDLEPVPLR